MAGAGLRRSATVRAMVPSLLYSQVVWLFVLALPVASIAWTITHEEIFREPREWAEDRSRSAASVLARKFFYICTCEYCFSHYVAAAFIALTDFQLLPLSAATSCLRGPSRVPGASWRLSLRLSLRRATLKQPQPAAAKQWSPAVSPAAVFSPMPPAVRLRHSGRPPLPAPDSRRGARFGFAARRTASAGRLRP